MKKIIFTSLLALAAGAPATAATIVQSYTFVNGRAFANALNQSRSENAVSDGFGVYRAEASATESGGSFASSRAQLAFNSNTGTASFNTVTSENFAFSNENDRSSADVSLIYRISATNTGNQAIDLFLDYSFAGLGLDFDTPNGGTVSPSSLFFGSALSDGKGSLGGVAFDVRTPRTATLTSPFGFEIPCVYNSPVNTAISCTASARSGSAYLGTLAAGQSVGGLVVYDLRSSILGGPSLTRNQFSVTNSRYSFRGVDIVPTAPVPEPATWAMMIAGFGAIGTTMRRRRLRVSFG